MQKFLHSQIFRAIRPQNFTAKSNFSSFPDDALEDSISNKVLALINSARPIEPALAELSPSLNREVVISVLQSQAQLKKDPVIGFRFFIWASDTARLRSSFSNKLMVDILLSGGNVNSLDLCWSVLDELRNENMSISANAFAVLILGYWRLGNAEKAVDAFGRMKDYDCEPNLFACNVILHVLVQKNVILLALAVYNMMLKSNIDMGCDTFNVLIDGLCKNEMTEAALNLFDEMTSRGILPNRITYTVVISGLCKTKRVSDAYNLFNEMVNSGCEPDPATYNTLIDGFCKQGLIDEACVLLKSFQADGYDVGIKGFSCLIHGLAKANRIGEAEELFQRVLEVGLEPDVVLYTIMMHGLSVAGRMKDAVNLFRDMLGKGVVPDTQCYNVLIKGFCDLGLLDDAESLKLEISQHDQFPNTCTYTILICGFCRNGLLVEAQQIFNDMEKLGCSPSVVTFNALIDGLCKAGKLEEAQLVLYKMEVGRSPSLFLRLSQGADRILDTASLQKKVEDMMDSGLILKAYNLLKKLADSGVVPNVQTYNTLIHGMCRAGHINIALKLLEELQLKGHSPDSVTYATLIYALQRVDRDRDAYKLFEQMNANGCKPSSSVYKTFMSWSCRKREMSVTISFWLKYLKNRAGVEDEVLQSVEECFAKGEFEQAVRNLLEMDIKLSDFDSAMYDIWLFGLCQAKRAEEAQKAFYVLEEFNVPVSAPSCVLLIRALCFKRELNKAVDIFLYTLQKGYRLKPRLCNNLVEALLKSKDKVILALELLDRMKSAGYDLNSHLYPRTKSLLPHIYSLLKVENAAAR
ncbi:pentatricopeptide repeat-containing protein At1g79540 isoform X1 [Salvia miltiorrhiza]|uniref:pentatricopeptide repeat-containing protein At1g79540 isoform X1 n=1 Tax=Salvia miltiorrhiza TaxID=226208 RepID=UPI0025ACE7FC|nr:pentatricopeptide repeat-containing protein At1g79540 isoform X1 [Salvia miltiorrhiza]